MGSAASGDLVKFFLAVSCPCCGEFTLRTAEADDLPPGNSELWQTGKSFKTEREALASLGIPESFVQRSVCKCGTLVMLSNFPIEELRCQQCV